MAEFLTTNGISRKLTEIIASAKTHLIFVSPYFQLSAYVFTNILQAANSNVKVKVLYGKVGLEESKKQLLQKIPYLE